MDAFISSPERNTGKEQMDAMRGVIQQALNDEYRIMAERQTRLAEERFRTRMMIILGMIAAVVTALLTGILLSRSILRPLKQAVNTANTIAAGDLTSTIRITRWMKPARCLRLWTTCRPS